MPEERPVIVIIGPTAGGKTRLAIDLARALPGGGECLCADSMQVYRGMNIGTAKPTERERAEAPHHLLDLVDPIEEGFNVDRWLEEAKRTVAAVRRRDRTPIIVGGTNLYVQAFLEGMGNLPAPDERVRAELAALDPADRRARLEHADPAAASRIHPNDERRTIRALEVHALTGRPLSAFQGQWDDDRPRDDQRVIGLEWSVETLNRRINVRVRAMIDAGLVEEVRRLRAGGRLGRQASEALGYGQILDHLEGRLTEAEAIEQIKIRTRRYAKQQRTWLRRFRRRRDILWLSVEDLSSQDLVHQALTFSTSGRDQGPGPAPNAPIGQKTP